MTTQNSGLTLVVLAAGMGSRYGGLKQLAAVNPDGNAILDYSVFDALRAGFERIVFVIRHDIEADFRRAVSARFESHADVAYAFQSLDALPPGFSPPPGRTKPWGTLQATLIGAEHVIGPFAVINADDFYGAFSFRTLAQHLRTSTDSAMVGFPLRNTLSPFGPVSRGLCRVSPDGLLLSTTELTHIVGSGDGALNVEGSTESPLEGNEIVSMNMWGFTPALIEPLRRSFHEFLAQHAHEPKTEAYLPMAVNELVARDHLRVRVLRTTDAWAGVTYPEDLPHVVAHIRALTRQGDYPESLWS